MKKARSFVKSVVLNYEIIYMFLFEEIFEGRFSWFSNFNRAYCGSIVAGGLLDTA